MPRSPDVTAGRWYFAVQALLGAAWWSMVFTTDAVRRLTLGELDPVLVAALDIPLFVIASALVALGMCWAVWIVVPWTALVAVCMATYATITTSAGWGALLMVGAAVAGAGAGFLVVFGRFPTERILRGPFAFRPAAPGTTGRHVRRTVLQLIVFWGVFLLLAPAVIAAVERRWRLDIDLPFGVRAAGAVVLIAASALGIWSALAMSTRGAGTPLPSETASRLVVSGPYRFVRNPMAVAGITQGVAVGMLAGSWLVILYALCGSVMWNALVRPLEEDDLERRFGDDFRAYRDRVRCWVPRLGRGR
ncbi:methyltransferase family protein [Microbacterium sp. NPDC055903]